MANIVMEVLVVIVTIYKAILTAIFRAIFGAPKKSVAGEKILITGAGSGLGRLMAIDLSKRGAEIVAWDINTAGNKETARIITENGGKIHTYTVDISEATAVKKAANQVIAEVGNIDILINNAGIVTGKKILECQEKDIVKTFEVNVLSHFWTTQCFLQSMLDRNHGHIVNIASMAGMLASNRMADYSASKFADVGFSESLQLEINDESKFGVKVTTVCPFFTNTGMFEGVKTRFPSIFPILDQDEVARKIVHAVLTNQKLLCLPRAMYFIIILKAILPVDAGWPLYDFLGAKNMMKGFVGRQKAH